MLVLTERFPLLAIAIYRILGGTLARLYHIRDVRNFDSNPPSPRTSENCQKPQQETSRDQGRAYNARFIEWINERTPSSNNNQPERNQKSAHEWWGLTTDDWLVFFTGALVFVGFIQFLVFRNQSYWLRRTVESAENSMLILEGAYVFADITGTSIINVPIHQINLTVRAINHGETVGLVSWIGWDVQPFTGNPISLPTTLVSYPNHLFVGWVLGKGENKHASVAIIPYPTANLLFHGVVIYEDIFGEAHYCGFAWRINASGSWQPISDVDAYARHDKRRRPTPSHGWLSATFVWLKGLIP